MHVFYHLKIIFKEKTFQKSPSGIPSVSDSLDGDQARQTDYKGYQQTTKVCTSKEKQHLLSSTDNLCKLFGPRSGRFWSGSKPFDSAIVFADYNKSIQNYQA